MIMASIVLFALLELKCFINMVKASPSPTPISAPNTSNIETNLDLNNMVILRFIFYGLVIGISVAVIIKLLSKQKNNEDINYTTNTIDRSEDNISN